MSFIVLNVFISFSVWAELPMTSKQATSRPQLIEDAAARCKDTQLLQFFSLSTGFQYNAELTCCWFGLPDRLTDDLTSPDVSVVTF